MRNLSTKYFLLLRLLRLIFSSHEPIFLLIALDSLPKKLIKELSVLAKQRKPAETEAPCTAASNVIHLKIEAPNKYKRYSFIYCIKLSMLLYFSLFKLLCFSSLSVLCFFAIMISRGAHWKIHSFAHFQFGIHTVLWMTWTFLAFYFFSGGFSFNWLLSCKLREKLTLKAAKCLTID